MENVFDRRVGPTVFVQEKWYFVKVAASQARPSRPCLALVPWCCMWRLLPQCISQAFEVCIYIYMKSAHFSVGDITESVVLGLGAPHCHPQV